MGVVGSSGLHEFARDGFLRLEAAFPRELALRCRERVWAALDEKPTIRETWTRPVARLFAPDDPAFQDAATSPRWVQAIFDVAGPDAAPTRSIGGTFAVRFPVNGDPGDDGWHIDGSYVGSDGTYWVNHRSRSRALLMLALFSDVGEADAPTRLRVGSHRLIASVLRAYGDEGLPSLGLAVPEAVQALPVALATGRAGDVFLCHPFLVHAAQRNRGTEPRFVAQPGVPWREGRDGYPSDLPRARAAARLARTARRDPGNLCGLLRDGGEDG